MENPGIRFLHQKDSNLQTSTSVEHEQIRKKLLHEKTSQKPTDKISDWLEVIEKTHLSHPDDPRVLERIKNYYHKEYVIDPENIPESVFMLEPRIARQDGRGNIEITDSYKEAKRNQIINDQRHSLDRWVNYLSSPDSKDMPIWAKYWAFKSMLKMGKFEKQQNEDTEEEKLYLRIEQRIP